MKRSTLLGSVLVLLGLCVVAPAQQPAAGTTEEPGGAVRGSLVEDRAARKLLEAGDARLDANEASKAVEVWQSVIERYPRSRVRFDAHMRLGNHFLKREAAPDRARAHFEDAAIEENRDEDMRAEALLSMGICFYEGRNYGKCFKVMREVIEKFPVSKHVNQAYYYIGLGHFQLGHYSRSIAALEKVGTALTSTEGSEEKLESGKRLFVKIEDADLAVLETEETVEVVVESASGDTEKVVCHPVGRNVRVVLGSIPGALGTAVKGDGVLQIQGGDKLQVVYVDSQTADRAADRKVLKEIKVVGSGRVEVTDGAFGEKLRGVVLDRGVNLQIIDADLDVTPAADALKATAAVYREKTVEELDQEAAKLAAEEGGAVKKEDLLEAINAAGEPRIDRWKKLDEVAITLTEVQIEKEQTPAIESNKAAAEADAAAPPAEAAPVVKPAADDGSLHTGVFRFVVPLRRNEEITAGDDVLQALPGDVVRITYVDDVHLGDGVRTIVTKATVIEGNLGGPRVTQTKINDQELRIKTQLKTASALTNIGNRYKEFGLKANAQAKYQQALDVSDQVYAEARVLGGRLLEETYVQLWQSYFAMDQLELAAAMAQRLQAEFPNSGFVDDALLQLAEVARKQNDLQRAIGLFSRLVSMEGSQLRGEAQFGIAECYEGMAKGAAAQSSQQLLDRAFLEYKKVFEQFPDSGRIGEAVSKMANYYYDRKDYTRAVDTFETVLGEHPDAKFLDVILFNYGRCLYRMNRKGDAQKQFNQLITDFPESPLAEDAKRIAEALTRTSAPASTEEK